jgi:hypothetical protein
MAEWMYRSTFSWPRYYLEESDQVHAPAALTPDERAPSTHWIGGWVGPRTGLDDTEKRVWIFYIKTRSSGKKNRLLRGAAR